MRRLLLVLILGVSGCATPYQPQSFTGGYKDQQVTDDIYQVSVRGNGYTGSETVQQYALRRAAELTVQHGFDGFVILNDAPDTTTGAVALGGSTQVIANGNVATAYSSPTTFVPVRKHQATMMIRMYHGKAPDGALGFDAKQVLANLSTAQ